MGLTTLKVCRQPPRRPSPSPSLNLRLRLRPMTALEQPVLRSTAAGGCPPSWPCGCPSCWRRCGRSERGWSCTPRWIGSVRRRPSWRTPGMAIGAVAEEGDGLVDFVFHGVERDAAGLIGRFPDGCRGLLGALIHEPEPVRLANLEDDPRFCGFPEHHPRMRSFLGVPIRVQGEIFGNLYLTEKRGGGSFSDYDLDMVGVLATEAGIAIGNARLYEAAQQRERWIDGSVAVTTALLSGGGAEDALQVVAEQARRLSGSAAGAVLLPAAEGGLEVVAVASEHPSKALGMTFPPENEFVAELLDGKTVFVEDAATDSRMVSDLARVYGPMMMLP